MLTGCETMNDTMASARERITAMEFKMPDIQPRQDGMRTDQDSGDPAFEPYDYGKYRQTDTPDDIPVLMAAESADISCPPLRIVDDLRDMHQFSVARNQSPPNKISSVSIENIEATCTRNDSNLAIDMHLIFDGTLGPRARMRANDRPGFAYPYFVAVTDPQGAVLSKEIFAATLSYGTDDEHLRHTENLRQLIPYGGERYNQDYEILVGFQLTPEELAYNRARHTRPPEQNTARATAAPMKIVHAPRPQEKPDEITRLTRTEPAAAMPSQKSARATQPDSDERAPATVTERDRKNEGAQSPAIDVPFIDEIESAAGSTNSDSAPAENISAP